MSNVALKSIQPLFGVTYRAGDIGFTMTHGDLVSEGIAYFERWERVGDIPVSHAFVVTGDDDLVEAHIQHGVQRDSISKYFRDPRVAVFFRRSSMSPAWQREMAQSIVEAAESKIGCPYARGLIAADLLADSFAGHWFNKIFRDAPDRIVRALLSRPNRFICSELAAYALKRAYMDLGCAAPAVLSKQRLDSIDPQALFQDAEIFEDEIRAVHFATQPTLTNA